MIAWKKMTSGRKPTGFQASVTDAGEGMLASLWTKVLDELEAAPPDGGWEILVAYFTIETGDVLVYPTSLEEPSTGQDRLDVILHVDAWEEAYGDLPDPEVDEKGFERGYDRLLKAQAKALKTAIADPSVARRFAALKKRPSFALYYVDGGESVHRANLEFLWGNRPPKGIPHGSAKEVFRYLLEKASIWADDCMEFEGEFLRSVTFFGGNFNNKYVDLLEGVPDLAALCADLRTLKLEHTRITPAGVERLRKILPAVNMRIVNSYDDEGE